MFFTALVCMSLTITFETNMQKLDSDEWAEREDAQKMIRNFALQEIGIKRIKKDAKEHKSLEVRRRLKRVLDHYYNVTPTKWSKTPWIDCIPDENERAEAIKKYLKPQIGNAPEYEGYRHATSQYIKDKMENEGWTRTRARKFLDSMVPEEIAQMKKNPSMYPQYADKPEKKAKSPNPPAS